MGLRALRLPPRALPHGVRAPAIADEESSTVSMAVGVGFKALISDREEKELGKQPFTSAVHPSANKRRQWWITTFPLSAVNYPTESNEALRKK